MKPASLRGRQGLTLLVLGVAFPLSVVVAAVVVEITGQVSPLSYLVPICLGFAVSLAASVLLYLVKREWTTIVAVLFFLLAVAMGFVLVAGGGGFAY